MYPAGGHESLAPAHLTSLLVAVCRINQSKVEGGMFILGGWHKPLHINSAVAGSRPQVSAGAMGIFNVGERPHSMLELGETGAPKLNF